MKKLHFPLICAAAAAMLSWGCTGDFLDVKKDARVTAPDDVADFQEILDNASKMNNNSCHQLALIGSDEYFLRSHSLAGISVTVQRNAHTWAVDVFEGESSADWNNAYERILHANIVLDGLAEVEQGADQQVWENVKGSALFFRAFNHYQLAQQFCMPFAENSADTDLGLPLRVSADVTQRSERSSVRETYAGIIADLEAAVDLLPEIPIHIFRPSKAAAYGLLAKTYLLLADYRQAAEYADRCLAINGQLVDFNTLDKAADFSFPADYGVSNPEIIFYCYHTLPPIISRGTNTHIDTALLALYDDHDLRKSIYFRPYSEALSHIMFKGSYTGAATSAFTGIATDEIYLIRAECRARLGEDELALADLNSLLERRTDHGSFSAIQGLESDVLLDRIIMEWRREMVFRGNRWEFLRRLNREPRYSRTLQRHLDGVDFLLPPGDPRYTWPIPDEVVRLSGMQQNPR